MTAFRNSISANSETRSPIFSTRPHDASDDGSDGSDASNTSIISCVTSAEELATKATKLADWALSVKLDPVINEVVPDTAFFDTIRDLQAASTAIPSWLKNPDSPEFGYIFPVLQKWKNILCSTLQQSGSRYSTSPNEDLDFPCAVQIIFRACHNQELLRLPSYFDGSERSARGHIDSLMALSCEVDSDMLVKYSFQLALRLPMTTSTPMSDRIRGSVITASVLWVPVTDFLPYNLSPEFRTAASASLSTQEAANLRLVHCVGQFKRMGSSENLMKMAMISALQQKRVLGVQHQFVFGVFQFNSDFLQVNGGRWLDDEIKIYKIGTYTLLSPASLVEFQLLVRKINQLGRVYRDQLMDLAPALQQAIENKPPVDEWAPIRVAATREEFEESEDSEEDSEHSGGGSSNHSEFPQRGLPSKNGMLTTGLTRFVRA